MNAKRDGGNRRNEPDERRPGQRGLDSPSVKARMARFMEPCILLLLTAEKSHGYELMEKLRRFGFDGTSSDMATLYRTLRQLEEDDMVASEWEEGSQGPPKRVYQLTEDGSILLGEWISVVRENRNRLTTLIDAHDCSCDRDCIPYAAEQNGGLEE